MGIGGKILAMVQLLYAGTISWIGVNRHFSAVVAQEVGVHQGCPLSPLLYVLYLVPMLAGIPAQPGIIRLHIPGGRGWQIKVVGYVDDATLFLLSDWDFGGGQEAVFGFHAVTGASINRRKSLVLYVGASADQTDVPEGFSLCLDGQHVLGGDGKHMLEGRQHPQELGGGPRVHEAEGSEVGCEGPIPVWEGDGHEL